MTSVFLEVIFSAADFAAMGRGSRDEIEDQLDAALSDSQLGEIVGGGAGSVAVTIDVEIKDEVELDNALLLIREVLRGLSVPQSTIVRRAKPSEITYPIYDPV